MEDQRAEAGACSRPPALDDIALIAAVDGEASANVNEHLRACPYCAQRAQAFAELQGLLRKRLYRVLCPSSEELAAFQQGWLEQGRHTFIRDHLRTCPHCSAELGLLAEAAAVQPESPSGLGGRLRRVVAELLAPRPPAPLAAAYGALRGPGSSAQYAYRAENIELMLDVERAAGRPDRLVLLGLLLLDEPAPTGLSNATASLLSGEQVITSAPLDPLGNFVLDNLVPGDYSLSVRLPDREVVVEALSL
jgi:anti-sigma factor RsiW